jgi:Carboxypeptidase regulatory-like domain
MSILSRIVAVVSFALLCAAPVARAGTATLEGIVKDASGQPLRGAEIRIQGSDATKVGIIHTDAKGHYAYPALETGDYQVSLIVNGAVKASINNVKAQIGHTETLNFELKGGGARPFAQGRHYVWIPANNIIGSHLGGWVEVTDDGKSPQGMRERMNNQGNALVKELWDQHPSQGGM